MLQAWDFIPGSNFVDFIDVGVSEATLVVAVLTSRYQQSRWGRVEWQMAMRASPDEGSRKLVTVRTEECDLDGILALLTFVDLVGESSADNARDKLVAKIAEAFLGRGKPPRRPGFPPDAAEPSPAEQVVARVPSPAKEPTGRRRRPPLAPAFPPAATRDPARSDLSVLHLSAPRFSR